MIVNRRWDKTQRHDEIILNLIGTAPVRRSAILPSGRNHMEEREIDRALQRLRRAGKIKVVRGEDCGPGGSWVRAAPAP